MEDLRVKELSEKIGDYEIKVEAAKIELKDCRKKLGIFKEELKQYLDGKQGNLIEI